MQNLKSLFVLLQKSFLTAQNAVKFAGRGPGAPSCVCSKLWRCQDDR